MTYEEAYAKAYAASAKFIQARNDYLLRPSMPPLMRSLTPLTPLLSSSTPRMLAHP